MRPAFPERDPAADAECERVVRKGDADRTVSTSFAAPDRRASLFSLYAFNLETARIRDLVSQPLPGEIRLQWWRDRIEAGAESAEDEGQGSPVASALIRTIRSHDLPVDVFARFLDARIFDLYEDPMPSREDFETYAGETASTLIMLAAMILDRAKAAAVADLAGHAGVAQAITGVLRSLDRDRARHKVFIPGDIIRAVGLDAAGWLVGEEPARAVVEATVAYGREHLRVFRQGFETIPRVLRPAFLPALLCTFYLDQIEAGRFEPADAMPDVGPLRRSWTYWRGMRAAESRP